MIEPDIKLLNPPIVEAVLDIQCDMQPRFDLADVEEQAKNVFGDSYPQPRRVFFQEHKFQAEEDAPPEHSVRKGISALQYLQEDEKQLVQVRIQGYSFNRLAPYTSLDDYLPEIERTWGLFVAVVKPVQVRAISLRFINRIPLPLEQGAVDLEKYFRIAPRLPDAAHLTLRGFLNQSRSEERGTGHQVNIVLTAQQMEGQHLPVIFDNTVSSPMAVGVEDWPTISGKILALRQLKNRTFQEALTKECLHLFQRP